MVGGLSLHVGTVTAPDAITDIHDGNSMRAMQSAVWMYNRLTGSVCRVLYVRGRPGRNDVYDERTSGRRAQAPLRQDAL